MMLALRELAAAALGAVVVLGNATAAEAYHGDRIGGASSAIVGTTAGQIAAESGLLATGERAAGLLGPEGYAVGTMAGCFVGIGAHGWSNIGAIASSLNPFDRSPRVKQ